MKPIVLAVVVAFALPAAADPLSDVCGRLIGKQVTQCLAAGRGRFIDPDAAPLCGNLIGGQVISCVSAIAGKDYEPDQANACGALIGGQVIDCFRRTGQPHADAPPPPPPAWAPLSTGQIRAEIAAALAQLNGGDSGGAAMRLQRLLNALH
jgi:hypothetical protein